MRVPLLLSVLVATTMAACNQSLTHDMTGTGGTETAVGGAGGAILGTGGVGGSNSALCDTLVAEYQSAFIAAETCQVGGHVQCQQITLWEPGGCCYTYVNDNSALGTILSTWRSAGCTSMFPNCANTCSAALSTICVSTDGGSEGTCSAPLPGAGGTGGGATGGTSGADGSAPDGTCQRE